MYKIVITDESGATVFACDAPVLLLSTVDSDSHVEARGYCSDVKLQAPFMAGVIVAAQGLIDKLLQNENIASSVDDLWNFVVDAELAAVGGDNE